MAEPNRKAGKKKRVTPFNAKQLATQNHSANLIADLDLSSTSNSDEDEKHGISSYASNQGNNDRSHHKRSRSKSSKLSLEHMPSKLPLSKSSSSASIANTSDSSDSTSNIPEFSSNSKSIGKWDSNLHKFKITSGLDLGLELETIVKSHKIGGETFLVVKWVNKNEFDLVKLTDVTNLYPNIVLKYFTSLPRHK